MKHIIFTVTNNLNFDRRMHRICGTLATNGYKVTLVGISLKDSPPLETKGFAQKRLPAGFRKGPLFYAASNIQLFFFLLFQKCDAVCSIDADTLLPVYLATSLKRIKRIHDAHEYFSQMKEVVSRPRIHRVWHWIEKTVIPRFSNGYTVSAGISDEFRKQYGVQYKVVRNVPPYKLYEKEAAPEKILIYQGAVNEARGLENLIPAMENVDAKLLIYGTGNLLPEISALISKLNLTGKVILKGMVTPAELEIETSKATIGINLVENIGLNQYHSLANKFFDYIMHGIPQVTMNFPEYSAINKLHEVAVLIDDTSPASIAEALNRLLEKPELYARLQSNCRAAALDFNWEKEEVELLNFYKKIFE